MHEAVRQSRSHSISLSLQNGHVIASTWKIKVRPGDTIDFTSKDGKVDIVFQPADAVEPAKREPSPFQCVTVRQAPFKFGCRLIKDGQRVGWPEQEEAGGVGVPDPPKTP